MQPGSKLGDILKSRRARRICGPSAAPRGFAASSRVLVRLASLAQNRLLNSRFFSPKKRVKESYARDGRVRRVFFFQLFFQTCCLTARPYLNRQKYGLQGTVLQSSPKYCTLGARDFSSAVSGFCQVFIVTRVAARGFGLRPKMCRPSANTKNSRRTQEKSLVPRVKILKIGELACRLLSGNENDTTVYDVQPARQVQKRGECRAGGEKRWRIGA